MKSPAHIHAALLAVSCLLVLGGCTSLIFSETDVQPRMWRPPDPVAVTPPGIHLVEPYSADKIPVLFVHGINGSPANFEPLLEHLDRSRFQPWFYAYPSGARLETIAAHLDFTLTHLQAGYSFHRMAVISHSMGGLVGRRLILRQAQITDRYSIPLFVSISTPWNGHGAAKFGVRFSPVVTDAWRDLSPGSSYIRDLFAASLPLETQHYLIFTINDRKVSVTSQLSTPALREARQIFAFGDTHSGVLRDTALASLLNKLLDDTFPRRNY